MKFYIISDKVNVGIAISNIVNSTGNSAILSENITSISGQVEDLRRVSKSYDFYILASQTPNKTGIEANKAEGIRAVVAAEAENVRAVVEEAGANAIVVDSSLGKQGVSPIIREFAKSAASYGTSPNMQEQQPERRMQKQKQKRIIKQEEDQDEPVKEEQGAEGQNRKPTKEEAEEEEDTGPKGSGIVDKIKYAFGFD